MSYDVTTAGGALDNVSAIHHTRFVRMSVCTYGELVLCNYSRHTHTGSAARLVPVSKRNSSPPLILSVTISSISAPQQAFSGHLANNAVIRALSS